MSHVLRGTTRTPTNCENIIPASPSSTCAHRLFKAHLSQTYQGYTAEITMEGASGARTSAQKPSLLGDLWRLQYFRHLRRVCACTLQESQREFPSSTCPFARPWLSSAIDRCGRLICVSLRLCLQPQIARLSKLSVLRTSLLHHQPCGL